MFQWSPVLRLVSWKYFGVVLDAVTTLMAYKIDTVSDDVSIVLCHLILAFLFIFPLQMFKVLSIGYEKDQLEDEEFRAKYGAYY